MIESKLPTYSTEKPNRLNSPNRDESTESAMKCLTASEKYKNIGTDDMIRNFEVLKKKKLCFGIRIICFVLYWQNKIKLDLFIVVKLE